VLELGGEYAAVNSAIDELIPARLRGRVDIAINGTFWIGILFGSVVTGIFLPGRLFPSALGWRFAFLPGLPIGFIVLSLRRNVPESPRWLLERGRVAEAAQVLRTIEGIGRQGTVDAMADFSRGKPLFVPVLA
jgi:MFS family permease